MWLLLFLLGLAGVLAAGELSGRLLGFYCGAAGGLLLGVLGHLFASHATEPGRAWGPSWGIWVAGLLARLVVLLVLALVFWRVWPDDFGLPTLTMAAIYLAANLGEIGWLCAFTGGEAERG